MAEAMQLFDPKTWRLAHGRTLELGPKALIMGVLNVTPDSFSDGGDHLDVTKAVERANQMQARGAAIIDIGGESTKPNADPVDAATEQGRILPVIEALSNETDMILSVDTYRAETAELAVAAGAHIVNDVWGCQREPDIAKVAANSGAGLVIMNTRRERSVLDHLPAVATQFLTRSVSIAQTAGVPDDCIVLDPGFGFAKTIDHDIPILCELERLHAMGYDAYQLIAALFAARTGPMPEIDGATGKLYLDDDGRIHRKLAWAQFQSGEAVALPDLEPTGGPIQDISDEAELMLPDMADEEAWPESTQEL